MCCDVLVFRSGHGPSSDPWEKGSTAVSRIIPTFPKRKSESQSEKKKLQIFHVSIVVLFFQQISLDFRICFCAGSAPGPDAAGGALLPGHPSILNKCRSFFFWCFFFFSGTSNRTLDFFCCFFDVSVVYQIDDMLLFFGLFEWFEYVWVGDLTNEHGGFILWLAMDSKTWYQQNMWRINHMFQSWLWWIQTIGWYQVLMDLDLCMSKIGGILMIPRLGLRSTTN